MRRMGRSQREGGSGEQSRAEKSGETLAPKDILVLVLIRETH